MTEMGILYTAEMDLPDADIEALVNFRHAVDLIRSDLRYARVIGRSKEHEYPRCVRGPQP